MQIPNLSISKQIYEELKFWGPVIGIAISAFKLYNHGKDYLRDIKDNHLARIQSGISEFNNKLDKSLENQTERLDETLEHQTSVLSSASSHNTNEIKELRGDIKLLTSALVSKPKRARKK